MGQQIPSAVAAGVRRLGLGLEEALPPRLVVLAQLEIFMALVVVALRACLVRLQ
jgi:hypothetical protein